MSPLEKIAISHVWSQADSVRLKISQASDSLKDGCPSDCENRLKEARKLADEVTRWLLCFPGMCEE